MLIEALQKQNAKTETLDVVEDGRPTALQTYADNQVSSATKKVRLAKPFTFREYFAFVLLLQRSSQAAPAAITGRGGMLRSLVLATQVANKQAILDRICDHFERNFLYQAPKNDHWHMGKELFRQKVMFFVERRMALRFCLPAFPCKSSNREKVATLWPDGAEFEALINLHRFCAEIRKLYQPGCVIDIVSDGHVFADCIGVDDGVVSDYNHRLSRMSRGIHSRLYDSMAGFESNPITFQSLRQILFPKAWVEVFCHTGDFPLLQNVDHPVATRRTADDDLCRGLLLHTCGVCKSKLHDNIREDPTSSLTMLYRGFSRFMMDDLQQDVDGIAKSKKQKKKLAERVALEMMVRNQAYSNLIELVMPRHVRLSIHAHNNAGPKFGIQLLPEDKFETLTTFDNILETSSEQPYDETHHLHIPTPWHNVLVEIEGRPKIYICKAGLVMAELEKAGSPWSASSKYVPYHPRGGRFILRKNTIDTSSR